MDKGNEELFKTLANGQWILEKRELSLPDKQEVAKSKDISGEKIDSSMMMGNLSSMKKHIEEICENMSESDVAPDWVKAKITEASAHLSVVADYIAGLKHKQ